MLGVGGPGRLYEVVPPCLRREIKLVLLSSRFTEAVSCEEKSYRLGVELVPVDLRRSKLLERRELR